MVHKAKKFEYEFSIAKKPPLINRLDPMYWATGITPFYEKGKYTSKKIKLTPEQANKKFKELKKKGLLVEYDFSPKQQKEILKKMKAETSRELKRKAGWL
jgi:hypothetical protein